MPKASFDSYALAYDAHFTHSPIGLLQRAAVHKQLIPLLHRDTCILELNCGTGADAFALAPKVKKYVATDVSEQMIALCNAKLQKQAISHLSFKLLAIQQIGVELNTSDFVFSDFGGLNCISPQDLQQFADTCSMRVPKDADLFFVIMGRKCIWEQLYFLFKLQFKKARRRLNLNGVATNINGEAFSTWYYAPSEIKAVFRNDFAVIAMGPIGLWIPPSYLNPFFEKRKRTLSVLNRMEKIFSKFKWTANYADHYYIHLRKKR